MAPSTALSAALAPSPSRESETSECVASTTASKRHPLARPPTRRPPGRPLAARY